MIALSLAIAFLTVSSPTDSVRTVSLDECRKAPGVADTAMGVCLDGKTLYVIGGGVLHALDVTDPLRPTVLGRLPGMDNNRQLVVQDGFAYVVSRETGLRIVDVRDPRQMRLRSRYDSVEFATGIDIVGKTVFLSERIYGVEVVDVSDPDRPAHVCIRKTGESQSNRYRNGYLYSGEWGGGRVTVFDARDLKDFRQIGSLELGGFGDGIEIDGDFLYCSTGHDAKHRQAKEVSDPIGAGRGLDIFSLAVPAKPVWVSRVDFPVFTPRNDDYWTPRVANGLAFCCDSHNGLFVVDVRDPMSPRLVARFCVPQKGKSWPSGAISSCAIGDGCVYVTSNPGGLWILPADGVRPPARQKGAPPKNATCREAYPTDAERLFVYRPAASGQARTVALRCEIAYAAFGDAGLHVLRLSEKGFEKLGELPGNRRVTDCCLVGEKLLTAEGTDGFAVYELDGPAAFREVKRRGAVNGGSVAFWCWPLVDGKVILTARGSYGIYDLSDFMSKEPVLKFAGKCQWDKYPADGVIGGRFPVLVPTTGLIWLDVGGPRPRLLRQPRKGEDPVCGTQACGLCRFGGNRYLYVVRNGMEDAYVFVNPDGTMSAPGRLPCGLGVPRADGSLVLLTNRSGRRVSVVDFADERHPKLLREFQLSGNPDCGTFFRKKILVPAGHQGLVMEK